MIVGKASRQFRVQKEMPGWFLAECSNSARGSGSSSIQAVVCVHVVVCRCVSIEYEHMRRYTRVMCIRAHCTLSLSAQLSIVKGPLGHRKVLPSQREEQFVPCGCVGRLWGQRSWTDGCPLGPALTPHSLRLCPQLRPLPRLPLLSGRGRQGNDLYQIHSFSRYLSIWGEPGSILGSNTVDMSPSLMDLTALFMRCGLLNYNNFQQ